MKSCLSATFSKSWIGKTPLSHNRHWRSKRFSLSVLAFISLSFFALFIYKVNHGAIAATLDRIPLSLVITIVIVYSLSGFVKGLSGIGMGLICVPMISLLYSPGLAVSLVAVPLIVTNFYQGLVSGDVRKSLKGYWVLATVMVTVMIVTVYLSKSTSPLIVTWAVGISAIFFVLLNLGIKTPTISEHYDSFAQFVTGCVAGVVGGLTGLVVIPVVIYITARGIRKDQFIAVSGLLLFLSGATLLAGISLNKTLTFEMLALSTLAALPALFGTFIGESIRTWISEGVFRIMVLCLILGIGVNTLALQLLP